MKSLRHLRLLTVLLLGVLPGLQVFSQAIRTIGGFEQVSEAKIQGNLTEYTYRATLTNNGPGIIGATATASSLSPDITIVDGGLTFGAAAAGASVVSSDTFAIRLDRRTSIDWSTIRWTIDAQGANQPPVANAGPDQTTTTGSRITLNGSGSTDADGNSLTYSWTLVSRPAGSGASLQDPTDLKPGLDIDLPGSYVISLTVNDGAAKSAPDVVIVSTTNSRPMANAGRDQTANRGTTVRLDGSGSTDADGNRLRFKWSFLALPTGSSAVLNNPDDVTPTFTTDLPGRYVVQLIVDDGVAVSSPAVVTISTANSKPVARAGADQTVSTGSVVSLNGSDSTDADGDSLKYSWSFASRPPKSEASLSDRTAVLPTFVADVAGTYVAQLIVSDGAGSSEPRNVVIATRNSIPVANASATQSVGVGSLVLLDGSGSVDVDGDSLSYRWAFTTQPAGSTASLSGDLTPRPSFITDRTGTYVVQLIVNDGVTNSSPATVTVTTLNSPPIANAGPDQLDAEVDDVVTLSGTASSNSGPINYAWSFIARPAGSTATLDRSDIARPTFVADEEGDYVLQLVVNDGTMSSKPDTVLIRVPHGNAKVTVEATDPSASETGPDTGTFTFSRSSNKHVPLTVLYSVSGTATNGTDYRTLTGTLLIPGGQKSATLTVTPIIDGLVEGDETVVVTVLPSPDYRLRDNGSKDSGPATVTIKDGVATVVTVAATDATASETGPDPGTFTFTRTGPTTAPLVVQYSAGGTATNGTDYTPTLSGSITIPSGQASATATITPVDDATIEGDETAIVTLTANAAYSIVAPGNATVTIADNDVPSVTVAATDAAASETGPDPGTFTFTRTGPTTSALVVLYGVSGTATNGTDYTPTLSGSITIPSGQASATATITPVDDATIEGDETAIVTLTANAAYSIVAPGNATVTIADNDVPSVTVAATDAAASETGPDPGTFTFTRTGPTTSALVVLYGVSGTATNGTDYTPTLSGSITIPSGQASATATITPVDDATIEGDETAIVTLSANAAYSIVAPGNATVTIADNDVPSVTVAATDAAASETGPDPGTFTFTRTGPTTSALVVLYGVSGTATNGTDYTPTLSGSITIPSGQASATATITPVDDATIEGDETAIVTLTANAAYSIVAPGNATVTIADNDVPSVTVAATDAAASETGPDPGTFTFTRTGPTTSALVVLYGVSGTATNGTDYTPTLSGSITIPSGQASATATITPVDDATIEGDETAIVTLSANAAYSIVAPGNATVTIADNDVPSVTVAATDAAASETGPDPGTFTFTRTGPTTSALVVLYGVSGTATNGTDYTPALSGSITIPSGQASATATITPVDDATIEGDETAIVTLTANAAYSIGAPGNATITIADNDVPAVTVAATDAAASETGPDAGTFTFTRTGPTTSALVVLYGVSGTATNGTDYTPTLSGSITIPSGQASATATITPVDDATIEGDETAVVTLTANAAYSIGAPGNATITIADNDVPSVTIAATDAAASETGPDAGTFTFTRTGPTTSALVVLYGVSGTATNGTDYTPTLSGSITIASGQASATATITPVDDATIEGDETAIVTLTANAAYSVGAPGNATITIADNDVPAVTVAATDAAASETGPDAGTFTFTRTGPTTSALVVLYGVSGTATNGTDYTPTLSGSITIPSGQASATVTITPVDDAAIEGSETAIVTLTANAAYSIVAPGNATITIADNDVPSVTVAATDAAASETGPDAGTFTFTRTGPTTSALVVLYGVSGTATNGTDYTPTLSGSITIPSGQASATATITPVDDATIEGDETAIVTLTANAAYSIGAPGNATITIADNDVPSVTVAATDAAASETGPDAGTFTFTRTGPTTSALVVLYGVSGTATNGTDFTPTLTGSLTIAAGQASATVTITPVDDADVEGNETVVVTLTADAAYSIGAPNSGTVTIADNDVPTVTVTATDAAASETGPDAGIFTFTRNGPTTSSLTILYSVGGTATNGTDFTPTLAGSVTIPAGQTSVDVTITPVPDNLVESPETAVVTLTANAAYSIGSPNSATVTIADNPAIVNITAFDADAAEAGGDTGAFTFTRSGGNLASALSVNYTVGGTATNGTDYTLISGSITIPANDSSATLIITPSADNITEPAETVILTLSSSGNYNLGSPVSGTVTIADNPAVVEVGATDPNAFESGLDPGVFTFTRSGGNVLSALQVFFSVSGTATQGTDYATIGTSVTIPANEVSATLTITPITDALAEGDETAVVTINSNASYTIGASNAATVTIHDATSTPLVSVTAIDSSASEVGPDVGVFRFTRTGSTTSPLTVTYSVGGTATNGADYVTIGTTIAIATGQASADLTITPIADALSESAETVVVTVTDGAAYDVGSPASATVTIADTGSGCGPEGGPLVNGATHCGTISNAGETDTWTFTANAGDRIAVHIGEVIDNNDFRPWIRVLTPSSATLGSNFGVHAAYLSDLVAPATGTYQVLVASADTGFDGTGTYLLTMAHTPGPITIIPGDQGGPLDNGAMHTGDIFQGDLDVWTFTANAGDRIAVNLGEITDTGGLFWPWIRVWAPNGANLGSNFGTEAAYLSDLIAPVTGTYLVLVASGNSTVDGVGTYRLTMTHTPGAITVSPGDQGGPLTNGAMQTGEILPGDLDVWTFTAVAGDRIAVNLGEITDTNGLFWPWIRVWGPNGANLGSNFGTEAAYLSDLIAPVTGTYLVLVGSGNSTVNGAGTYRLTMTHTPGPITVSTDDQGGPLENGALHTGEILRGDLDVWTFSANVGDRIAVNIGEITDANTLFWPWIRVWAPNGANLGSNFGTEAAQLSDLIAPVTGTYLVLVGSGNSTVNGVGTYRLTMTHTPGPITISPGDDGGPLTNGATHTGEILRGDLDVWTFSANTGDRIAVNIGEITDTNGLFWPWIRVWGPNGANLGADFGTTAAELSDLIAPTTGTYLVLVASGNSTVNGAGTYRLTMTHTPGPITISAGDEGGPLTNGATHTGTILLGDLDVWTFAANAGDRIAVNIGEITDTNGLFWPWIRVWGPNGANLGSNFGTDAAQLSDLIAPVTGNYFVLVASANSTVDGTGTYQLTMAHTPGPITISAGDEGGPVTLGATHAGQIVQGDLDVWTVAATAGEHITVQISQTSETDDFRPWIRLWAPSGATLGNAFGADTAAITNVVAPVTGTYLILVGSADSGVDGTGTYNLIVTKP